MTVLCSICGFEQKPGETHRQVTVLPSTRGADDEVLITCIVSQARYNARVSQQQATIYPPPPDVDKTS